VDGRFAAQGAWPWTGAICSSSSGGEWWRPTVHDDDRVLPAMIGALCLLSASVAAPRAAPDFGPGFNASSQPNMNGDFVLSATPGSDMSKFPKAYKDYPGGAESFDVWSPPITTLYSQVWWAPLAPAPFPDHIVQKYAGKGMAIIGWEIECADAARRCPKCCPTF
jgi:hypothetical protein